jgi:hypothetical protein
VGTARGTSLPGPVYGRDVEEPDDRTLLANAAVRLALSVEELVEAIGADHDRASRRRALGVARRAEGLAAGIAAELAHADPTVYEGARSPRPTFEGSRPR